MVENQRQAGEKDKEKDNEKKRAENLGEFRKITILWWIILVALLLWNVVTLLPERNPRVNIPYSTFIEQVKAGNVKEVTIDGIRISGRFKQPYTPPLPPPVAGGPPPEEAAREGGRPAYKRFMTVFPEAIGDPNLMPLLREKGVAVTVAPPTSRWITEFVSNLLPFLLLLLFFAWMGHMASRNQSSIFGFGRARVKAATTERPRVTFDDVAGADEAKKDLKEVIDFLVNPKKYHDIGARIPKGILLVGPPGTGKTLMAKAVAGEAKVPFFSISASEFVEMFVGVGASRVRDLFEKAKKNAPSIVFIDELDAVGRRRGAGLGTVNDEREQTLNQLLVEMDGFDEREEVIVLAATNRPDVLDPALLRPGRFDRQITVGLPDRLGREGILRIHMRKLRIGPDVDVSHLAAATIGFSGADLANLCNEAALIAARADKREVTMEDFEKAMDKILLGAERHVITDPEQRRVVAYHEAGHALAAWLTPHTDPVHKVTIVPRGRALGVTEQVPLEERYNYSRSYLLARLAVMLGGRTSEEVAIGEISTGAENDLIEATSLARRMVVRWGMSELGPLAFRVNEEQPFLGYEIAHGREYSEEMAALIDREVKKLIEERHDYVRKLLEGQRDKLDRLAERLLEKETLGRAELEDILGQPVSSNSTADDARAAGGR